MSVFSARPRAVCVKTLQTTNLNPKYYLFSRPVFSCFERESDLDVKWDNEDVHSSNLYPTKLEQRSSFILYSNSYQVLNKHKD